MSDTPSSASTPNPFAMFEPSADIRTFARNIREIHVAFMQAGFNPQEALTLTGEVIRGATSGHTS